MDPMGCGHQTQTQTHPVPKQNHVFLAPWNLEQQISGSFKIYIQYLIYTL